MSDVVTLQAVLRVDPELADRAVLEIVATSVAAIRDDARLRALTFGRFSHPRDEVRLRIAGPAGWLDETVEPELHARTEAVRADGLAVELSLETVPRLTEPERYGGELGAELTERIEHHDALACLALLELRSAGRLRRSVREVAVVMAERWLDRLGFDDARRVAFYQFASRWPSAEGGWAPEDPAAFDARFEELRDGLTFLASPPPAGGPERPEVWGGPEAAAAADASLAALAPVLARARQAHDAGAIDRDLVLLAWSWTHMHANRLGITAIQEAVLRQLMLRHHRARFSR